MHTPHRRRRRAFFSWTARSRQQSPFAPPLPELFPGSSFPPASTLTPAAASADADTAAVRPFRPVVPRHADLQSGIRSPLTFGQIAGVRPDTSVVFCERHTWSRRCFLCTCPECNDRGQLAAQSILGCVSAQPCAKLLGFQQRRMSGFHRRSCSSVHTSTLLQILTAAFA